MASFFFVRHGETQWNRQKLLQGHTDIALNDRGQHQAESLRPLIESLRPDSLVSSDLQRARQTAQIAYPLRQVTTTSLLREIHLGQGEGRTREMITDLWPDEWAAWNRYRPVDYETRFPGGESRREGIQRLLQLLEPTADPEPGNRGAYFTHGLLLRSFAQWTQNLTEAKFQTPNCCIYEFAWEPRKLHFDSEPSLRPRLLQIYLLPDEALAL